MPLAHSFGYDCGFRGGQTRRCRSVLGTGSEGGGNIRGASMVASSAHPQLSTLSEYGHDHHSTKKQVRWTVQILTSAKTPSVWYQCLETVLGLNRHVSLCLSGRPNTGFGVGGGRTSVTVRDHAENGPLRRVGWFHGDIVIDKYTSRAFSSAGSIPLEP